MSYLKNNSQLGSFGEFVYKKFAESLGITAQKVNILEHDFVLNDQYKVDVKTSCTEKTRYTGKRVANDICYDLIVVFNGFVTIYPDKNSPLKKHYGVCIGESDVLEQEWLSSKKMTYQKKKESGRNKYKLSRDLLASQIRLIFKGTSYHRIRFVFRGSVSKTRWSSSPDNLPGNQQALINKDLTVFIQMRTIEGEEQLEKIYLFDHSLMTKIKMKNPDKRQLKKGIKVVIDFEWFDTNMTDYIFNSIDALKYAANQLR